MRLQRKTLRHEPLEDRRLLAVDVTGLSSGAVNFLTVTDDEFQIVRPLEYCEYQSANVATTSTDTIATDTALVPNDIVEIETNSIETNVADVETVSTLAPQSPVERPVTWEQSEMYVGLEPVSEELESILYSSTSTTVPIMNNFGLTDRGNTSNTAAVAYRRMALPFVV